MEVDYIKEKLIYLKDLIKKSNFNLELYDKEKDINMKEIYFAAITKFSEEIIEIAIKINTKLIEENKDFASTYYKTFMNLSKYYKINNKILEEFAKTTSIRNKATHEYQDLFDDQEKSIVIYKNLVKMYPKYIKLIIDILDGKLNK